MNPPITLFQQALQFHQQGSLDQAQVLYETALASDPNHHQAMQLMGVVFSQRGNYNEALKWIDKAIVISPNQANTWNNRARVLLEAGHPEAALSSAQKALLLDPNHVEAWFNLGCIYEKLNNLSEAAASFARAIEINPNHVTALKSRSRSLRQLGRGVEALCDCERAIALDPNDLELLLLRAWNSYENGYLEIAIRDCKTILQTRPNDLDPLFICSQSMRVSGDFRGSVECLLKIQSINPNLNWLLGELMHTLFCLCDWSEMKHLAQFESRILQWQTVANPFVPQTLFNDPKLLLEAAKAYAQYAGGVLSPPLLPNPKGDKIKIGYYSSDFRRHPMAMLIREVIESHSRERFEIHLFSLCPSHEDKFRQKLRSASDYFHDVETLNDASIAQKSRELGIDIAIDLMGFTSQNRHKIFLERCAPVQAVWLGVAGTCGSPSLDYFIADPVVIPESNLPFYSEKVVHIPCYWPNDSQRIIAEATPTRESMGLPNSAFVFCCFNRCFKILPQTYYGWMRILAATPDSVLWLSGTNDEAIANLRKEAKAHGIAPERILFSGRIPEVEDHLARHRLADLFLDTFPYNAHTTSVDALWAGLPLLTRTGNSFASRVATSILLRIGLPELITDNQADFEARAIYLANDGRAELKAIREKLAVLRKTSPLFDGKAFAKDLEKAYQAMYDRSQAGLKPDFISVV